MPTALIVLAAGRGTRMNSDLPKVLHRIADAPLVVHAINSGAAIEPEKVIIVAGHGFEDVQKTVLEYYPDAIVVKQEDQKGTGHAVLQAKMALSDFDGDAVVVFGDTPFVRPETIQKMIDMRKGGDAISILGFEAKDPSPFGRLVMAGDTLEKIVESKDASDTEKQISLCNGGLVAANAPQLFDLLSQVDDNNASGEIYLTSIVDIAATKGLTTGVVRCDEAETMGINTRADLAHAQTVFQKDKRAAMLENGVYMANADSIFFSFDTEIGRDAIIEPYVVFGPSVTIETGATIRAFSHLEGCHVARGASVGPYARLRPGAELNENVKVGNFVEVKNAVLDEGAKVSHLSYIGDAHIGRETNVGAGTITCNYDGFMKHRTEIGENAFIGSNTMLVAPVTIGNQAMTATGSVINSDVPDGALAIARGRQVNKNGLAIKLFSKLRNLKEKRVAEKK